MTIDEYHQLPMEPGWNIEYIKGIAVWTPRTMPVKTVLTLRPLPAVPCPAVLRGLLASDREPLKALYVEAFAECIEFCDCEVDYVKRQAEKDIEGYFAGREAPPLPEISRVALSPQDGSLTGAILVRNGKRGRPVSELLFIAPAWQRRSVGTALITEATNQLHAAGHSEFVTGYALGNEASRCFYHRFGFLDSPSEMVAQKLWRCVSNELRRHEAGELGGQDRLRMEAERDHWAEIVRQWEARPHEERWRDRDE